MRLTRLVVAAVTLLLLGYVGSRRTGPLPALGAFLDPASGVFSLGRTADYASRERIVIAGLAAPVEVVIDDRGVPHVFAGSEEDAWRAQGYLVARDRLFQMELVKRSSAGTLSELFGARALESDRTARRRGLAWAADRGFAAADTGALIRRAARAYADGVNAWIAAMPRSALPLEYRLTGTRPSPWEPRHTYYLFSQMALTLAYDDETLSRLAVRARVGAEATEALFPRNAPIQEPIQPSGHAAPRFDFAPLPPPGPPDSLAAVAWRDQRALRGVLGLRHEGRNPTEAIGSNNWAVAPKRTAAGHALLAGDPHLELSLPSIWYEIHLQVRNGIDVAGVTFAGSPGVVIGFNRNVAWSFTNTGADVRDHYVETVDDDRAPTRYRLDGDWKPLERRIEAFRGRGGDTLAVDTLYATHRGPMVREGARWLSIRWTPFEATGPGEEFLVLNRSRTAEEWLEGWEGYVAPAQNGIVADRNGTIAIRSTGRYPVRPGVGRGDELRDGSGSASDWAGYVPLERYPFSRNPEQGFLASANQQPVDPRVNPGYLGSNWYSPWRALRINQLLRADSAVTPEAMRRFQTDPMSTRAEAFLPMMLRAAAGAGDSVVARAASLLAEWDHRYGLDRQGAVLFDRVMRMLARITWDELAGAEVFPQDMVLLQLMSDSASAWWDRRGTDAVETRDDILRQALADGYGAAVTDLGPVGEGWQWSRAHGANLYHLLRLPALSALDLPVNGGSGTLSPSPGNGTHGASWRMVVEMGPEVRGWGTYPGGQSGSPASRHYLDRLGTWQAGGLDTLLFPTSLEGIPASRVRATLSMRGSR